MSSLETMYSEDTLLQVMTRAALTEFDSQNAGAFIGRIELAGFLKERSYHLMYRIVLQKCRESLHEVVNEKKSSVRLILELLLVISQSRYTAETCASHCPE